MMNKNGNIGELNKCSFKGLNPCTFSDAPNYHLLMNTIKLLNDLHVTLFE